MKKHRKLTHKEEIIELEYELKKWKILLNLISKDIGQDKVIEIARNDNYPKDQKQLIEMIEQGKICNCKKE
jgi:hypothetical protein